MEEKKERQDSLAYTFEPSEALTAYINKGIQDIMKDIIKATFKDPAESLFRGKFARSVKKGGQIRQQLDAQGEHIPPFIIASITSSCNLYCKGCYARENHICSDEQVQDQLTPQDWKKVFCGAKELGIHFAGGCVLFENRERVEQLLEKSKNEWK